jgi:E3 ubiquitin-protein ligase HUWE1
LFSVWSQFANINEDDLRNPLSIHFVGEVGRDDGGVTRDWYSVLSKEIFNPQYGLFTCSAADDCTFQLNPNSGINPDHLDFFRFIGTIVGKALLDGCLLDAHFTRLVYKRILDKHVTYHDMATVDVQFYKSLVWVRNVTPARKFSINLFYETVPSY